jgi:hypothetical protein
VNGEYHGDVTGFDALNGEVGELEWIAGELRCVDDEILGGWESEDGGEEEGKVCDEGVYGLHDGSVVLSAGLCMWSGMRW